MQVLSTLFLTSFRDLAKRDSDKCISMNSTFDAIQAFSMFLKILPVSTYYSVTSTFLDICRIRRLQNSTYIKGLQKSSWKMCIKKNTKCEFQFFCTKIKHFNSIFTKLLKHPYKCQSLYQLPMAVYQTTTNLVAKNNRNLVLHVLETRSLVSSRSSGTEQVSLSFPAFRKLS